MGLTLEFVPYQLMSCSDAMSRLSLEITAKTEPCKQAFLLLGAQAS